MAELNKTTGSETGLSMIEQAAIVLLSMGEEPAAAVLRCLSREELPVSYTHLTLPTTPYV